MRTSMAIAGASFAFVALAACVRGTDPYEPGTVLGTYQVTGALQTNSCQEADAPNPWVFSVKLSHENATLYWDNGGLPVSGIMNADDVASMTSTSTDNVDGFDGGSGPCDLERDDSLTTTLTPDPKLAGQYISFTGALSYTFRAAATATDCSDQLAENGGTYATLPCTITYSLTATRTALANQFGQ
jgi:hypothetical protein